MHIFYTVETVNRFMSEVTMSVTDAICVASARRERRRDTHDMAAPLRVRPCSV